MNKPEVVLTLSIDTERDCSPTWHHDNPMSFSSVIDGIPNHLQPIFIKYGARPTYLISPEVLKNDQCIDTLQNLEGNYELGTHLHGEFIEPAYYPKKQFIDIVSDMQCYYPIEVEGEKLRMLTDLFIAKFGYSPLSFRAGRFAADKETISLLSDLGYMIDTSVAPHEVWNDSAGTLNFLGYPEQPYFPSTKNHIECNF